MQNLKKCLIIIIGDEILSGRVHDQNLHFLCRQIQYLGMIVDKAHILSDNTNDIASCLDSTYKQYSYIFTTGGLGPTHDDVTLLALNQFVKKANYDKSYLNDIQNMQHGKKECNFIQIGNIFSMPGVPDLVKEAAVHISNIIRTENLNYQFHIVEKEIDIAQDEKELVSIISNINDQFPNVKLGSYPFIQRNITYTKIVFTSTNHQDLDSAYQCMQQKLTKYQ